MLNKLRKNLEKRDEEQKKFDLAEVSPTSRSRSASSTTCGYTIPDENVTIKWGSNRHQIIDKKSSDSSETNKPTPLNFLHLFRESTQQMSMVSISTRRFSERDSNVNTIQPPLSPHTERSTNVNASPQDGNFTELVEGSFQQRNSKQRIYFYILKDGIVHLFEKAKSIKHIESQVKWPLSLVWILDIPDQNDPNGSNLFNVIGPDKVYQLKANTFNDRVLWQETFYQSQLENGISLDSEEREGEYTFSDEQGSVYTGSWKMGQMHGKGRLKNLTGVYDGLWENSVRSGSGVLRYSTGETYEGNWSANLQNGKGVLTYPGGDYYTGIWNAGKKHGAGDFIQASGLKYSGEWKKDLAHGRGVLESKEYVYDGFWKRGKFAGKGVLKFANNRKYEGDWCEGKKQGQGLLTWANGNTYQGWFLADNRHGRGKWISVDESYEGEWAFDVFEGTGTCTFANKDVYTGEWKKGKQDGKGKMSFATGSLKHYDGQWEEGLFQGHGTLEFRNGNRFEGQFLRGLQNGSGILYYGNGSQVEGKWASGDLEGRFVFQTGPFTKKPATIQGHLKDNNPIESHILFYPPKLPQLHVTY